MAHNAPPHKTAQEITKSDLLLFALYRLGGAGQYVDVEDVFVEVWRLAPARFSWRKYPYPQYKVAHVALSDVTEPGLMIRTSDGLSRQLTAKGVNWVQARLTLFEKFAHGEVRAPPNRRPSQRVLVELERNPLVKRATVGETMEVTRFEVATLLRCAPDAPSADLRERMETLMSAATDASRSDLVDFLKAIQQQHPGWFGGE